MSEPCVDAPPAPGVSLKPFVTGKPCPKCGAGVLEPLGAYHLRCDWCAGLFERFVAGMSWQTGPGALREAAAGQISERPKAAP